ncbi:MAG TPA: thioredoxin family protein [bacterium]|nr:thioredoxin family protein [bacterium]HPM98239.1 thioredoxin family protein [bacterium]
MPRSHNKSIDRQVDIGYFTGQTDVAFKASPELEEHKKYHIQTNESTDDDDHQSSGVRLPNLPKAGTDVPTSHRGKKLAAQLQKITDIEQFLELGVFMTPGLIINDKLVASGKLPTMETLTRWLENAAAQEQ